MRRVIAASQHMLYMSLFSILYTSTTNFGFKVATIGKMSIFPVLILQLKEEFKG